MDPSALLLAADLILAVHFLFAWFILAGFGLVWTGYFRGWAWVRGRAFRFTHAACMALVAAESLAGVFCPLTEWEWRLRQAALSAGPATSSAPATFLHTWADRLFYLDLPEGVFTVIYLVFAAGIGVMFWVVPVRRRGRMET